MICNNCGQINLLSDTLNAGDNVDAQEDNGFTGSFRNIFPTVKDDYTKKNFLSMQLEYLRPQRVMENNGKQYYKR